MSNKLLDSQPQKTSSFGVNQELCVRLFKVDESVRQMWRPMAHHIPVRICIGCRVRENTKNLVRVAYETTNDSRSLVLDQRGVLPGRGAWLHRDPECFSTALRKRAFARAFRGHVDTKQLEQAFAKCQMETLPTHNNDESGSEI